MIERFDYANQVECFFEEDEKKNGRETAIMVKFDQDGYWIMICYENGSVLKDYICQEEVNDSLVEMKKNEPNENHQEDTALLCCVGWRLDKFRDDGYEADWIDEDIDEDDEVKMK